jgi:Endoplasmic reticulum vesicle transporter/Endoplasmic Reticulum-Golgi Intermediate Compartment (ERGIC)
MWKSLDVLTLKSKEHIQVRTLSGGVVSAASLMIMVWLLISEFAYFRSTKLEEHLMVDSSQGERNMDISLELDLLAIPCKQADLRVEDSKGMAYEDARVHLTKTAITHDGRVAVGVGIHPDAAPGCKLKGKLNVRKVAGNFHVAAGTAFGMGDGHFAYSVSPLDFASYNASHIVRHLDFGPYFPTSYNQWAPLDGVTGRADKAGTQFQYHLKVVPTLYEYIRGKVVDSQQFSSTDFTHAPEMTEGVLMQPGVWFR